MIEKCIFHKYLNACGFSDSILNGENGCLWR